jgi:ThiF family
MTDLRFLRQQDVINATRIQSTGITLIGLGSIGSYVGVALAKMGALLTAYDADVVEAHNWSSQMYSDADIGTPKASAFIRLIEAYGGHSPDAVCQKYIGQELSELVISAVDLMDSRKLIWRAVREAPEVQLYIDCRMGLETLDVHVVRNFVKSDRVTYTETLCTDAEALQEPCTARSICYTPLMAASVIGNLVKRYCNDEQVPSRVILDLATFTLLTEPR